MKIKKFIVLLHFSGKIMTCSCRTFFTGSQDLIKILALIFSAFVSFTYKVFYVYLELTYTFVVSLLTTDIIPGLKVIK